MDGVGRARQRQGTLAHPEQEEKGCFVMSGVPSPRRERKTAGQAVLGEPSTHGTAGTAALPSASRAGPHCCHAVKMCSWLEFGSLAPGGEGTSLLTESGSCSSRAAAGRECCSCWALAGEHPCIPHPIPGAPALPGANPTCPRSLDPGKGIAAPRSPKLRCGPRKPQKPGLSSPHARTEITSTALRVPVRGCCERRWMRPRWRCAPCRGSARSSNAGGSGHFSSESVARGEKSCAQPGNLHKRTAICFPSPAFVPRSPRPAATAQTLRGNENESSRSAFPPAAKRRRRRRSGSCTSTAVPRTRMRAQEPSALMGALPAPAGPEQSVDTSVRRKGSAPSPRSQCCSIPPMAEKCASQRAGGKTSAHPAAIGVH